MHINRVDLLEKIIQIESCLFGGASLKKTLQDEACFFRQESGADVILVYTKNANNVEIAFVLEEEEHFSLLAKKYNLEKKHIDLNGFIEQCHGFYAHSHEYIKIETLATIFQGALSKKEFTSFEKEMDFQCGYLYPLYKNELQKVGFVVYFFTKEVPVTEEKLLLLTHVLITLISPFYDEKNHILYEKCTLVDGEMKCLTKKERGITHSVVHGKSYKEIGEEHGVSMNTLKTHMKNIFNKYCVNSKVELINKLVRSI